MTALLILEQNLYTIKEETHIRWPMQNNLNYSKYII